MSLPGLETVSQLLFCHSVQAKRDTESSIINEFWIQAFAGMTIIVVISYIMTQSPDRVIQNRHSFGNIPMRQDPAPISNDLSRKKTSPLLFVTL